jgi:hypothetical protein
LFYFSKEEYTLSHFTVVDIYAAMQFFQSYPKIILLLRHLEQKLLLFIQAAKIQVDCIVKMSGTDYPVT